MILPVEIKELVIRAVAQSTDHPSTKEREKESLSADKQSMIEACVKEVLRILKRSGER